MNRSLLKVIFFSALLGVLLGSFFHADITQASLFEDLFKFFQGPARTEESSPNPPPQVPLYKPAVDYEEAVVAAVEEASPSVVSIVISKDLPVIEDCPYDPFSDLPPEFQEFFGRGFEFSKPCEIGTERKEIGGGTGFIVSGDGLILTNKHVVYDQAAAYTVLTNDGEKYEAKVLARDPVQDLAVIKINVTGLKPAKLGDSQSVKLGQTAISIGNALGEFRNTVSVGVISGLARTVTASGEGFGSETIQGVIQTDAAINPGNSGGPLLNLKGEVIGINTAIATQAENIGFAIPINQAKRDIESVKKTGSIKVPYLGVRYFIINETAAKKQNLPVNYGALLRGTDEGLAVIPGSPAALVGLRAEDIILEVNGVKITENNSLGLEIQKYDIAEAINLKIRRGSETLNLKVVLTERPAAD